MTRFEAWNGREVEPIVAPAGNLYWFRSVWWRGLTQKECDVLDAVGTRNELAFEADREAP